MIIKKLFLVLNGKEEFFTTDEQVASQYEYYHATLDEVKHHPSLVIDEIVGYVLELADSCVQWFQREFIDPCGEEDIECGFEVYNNSQKQLA